VDGFIQEELLFHPVGGIVLYPGDKAGIVVTETLEGRIIVVSLVEDID